MKKEEIRVTIDSTPKQQKAIEILNRYNEPIWHETIAMDFDEYNNSLKFENKKGHNDWFVGFHDVNLTEITLDELEALLNAKKTNVFTDVQEWIRENMSNVTYTFQGNETPDCFKRLEQHLENDYPQGTEIKISKDKIEIYHS
jgi:hypothetical protein